MPEPPGLITRQPITPALDSAGVPGIRTLRSPRFRMLVALLLLVIGTVLVGWLLVRQASVADGQFGIDFAAYHAAAERMSAGASPYTARMLDGPIDVQGAGRYLYPPLLAQVLAPMTALEEQEAALVWLAVQAVAMIAALWIGTGIGGAAAGLERLLWCCVASLYFLPVFDSLWKGNVSTIIALGGVLVALGGASAGLGAAVGALLKTVPATLIPAALVMDRQARLTVIASLGAAFAVGALFAPAAWADYATVLRNMLAGSTDYASNLAPAAVISRAEAAAPLVGLVRGLAIVGAATSVVLSVVLARHAAGRPAAALLGVMALLLAPASLWYHYLAVLLPFAAIAWPRAGRSIRALLLAAAAMVTLGLAWLPGALLGAILLAGTSLVVLWPRRPLRRPGATGSPAVAA